MTKVKKKKIYNFTVIIEKDESGYYVGIVPDLRGCHTQAKSLPELHKRLNEAIGLRMEVEEKYFKKELNKNKIVMVFGTYDIFHEGHKDFFRQARQYGDYLIVVVARNATVFNVKKKLPLNDEKKRVAAIKLIKLADKVVLGSLRDKYAVIKKYRPDTICLGYDQNNFIDGLKIKLEEFNLRNTKVIRLKAYKPEIYKSSKLLKSI